MMNKCQKECFSCLVGNHRVGPNPEIDQEKVTEVKHFGLKRGDPSCAVVIQSV